jgi:N-methylhydantoinase B
MMSSATEVIEFELFRNAVFSIADEMAVTILRTAYSGVLKSVMDYSTALANAEGIVIAQSLTQPCHLGSIPIALQAVIDAAAGDFGPGDVYVMNDPYSGGMHLPDIFIFKAIFLAGRHVAYACTICHHSDVGGRIAGSNAADSTEIFQEGLRIPPLKLYHAGRPDTALFALLNANVRLPRNLMGDLRAQLAACAIVERELGRLADQFGLNRLQELMIEIDRYAERAARAAIANLPDGSATFEDFIDDDGVDFGRPIRLCVQVEKRRDRFLVDWTGSSTQVRGAINCTLSFTLSATFTAVKSILPLDLPNCAGAFRPIDVTVPAGTVLHAVSPAACAARGLTGFRTVDCCFGALAKLFPDRVPAAGDGGNTGVSIGGYYHNRTPFVMVDFFCAAGGARPFADGLDGAAHVFANISAHSIEEMEKEHPIRIRRFGYVPYSGGEGQYRGGCGVIREYELLAEEATFQVRADRITNAPFGLAGGGPGRPGRNTLVRAGKPVALTGKATIAMRRGDVVRIETAGGGGWGDKAKRDPAATEQDSRAGLVTAIGDATSVAAE